MSQEPRQFEEFLQTQLNPTQKKAVTHSGGSILVVAGAGSGKTRVITARIANLILKENVAPKAIVALTFTNKAAREMQERIRAFLGHEITTLPFIGTFHSYCLQLLKKNSQLLSIPTFSILDADDQKKIISQILKHGNTTNKINVKQVLYQISHIKNSTDVNAKLEQINYENPLIAKLYTQYEKEKKASNCFDFDDLLIHGCKLFNHDEFKQTFQKQIRHILVDEYQDTNVVQHALLKQMAQQPKKVLAIDSICVVGDEDQAIYSWRGATVDNIINFKKDFPKTKTVTVEQNYRSTQQILDIANQVIAHNTKRNPKQLWSDKKGSKSAQLLTCTSEYQEADAIIHYLAAHQEQNKKQSHAILYRTHFQSRVIEETLIKNSIGYKIIGGVQFYERKEIKDMLAYLRLVVNPFDRSAFFRIINCPARGLGAKFEEMFYERWQAEPFLSFVDLSKKIIEEGSVTRLKKNALLKFVQLYDNRNSNDKPSTALDHMLSQSQYVGHLQKTYEKEEAQERIENIKELLRAITHFEQDGVSTIADFLAEVALMQEKQEKEDKNQTPVFLMTLHAAKGLEFDSVIISGLQEGTLPSARSLYEDNQLEEERRLFYVGITRARKKLLLTHCRYRYTYGQMTDQLPSRFLDEVPKRLAPATDLSHTHSYDLPQFFKAQLTNTTFAPVAQSKIRKRTTAKPSTRKNTKNSSNNPWRKNQMVNHQTFGVGFIKKVEKRGTNKFFAHVQFKVGTKKIDTQFLTKI